MLKMILTGNVGQDPEIRIDPTGVEFVTFSVGVSIGTKDNKKTTWCNVSCTGKLNDVAKNYIRKGTKVLVEGFPAVNAYLNRENKPIGALRVYARHIELLSKRDDSENVGVNNNDIDY